MDILTHAALGVVFAGPVLVEHPVLALGFVFGSVVPDLDALSRVFGKRAFLRAHQTVSHSLLFQAVLSTVISLTYGDISLGAGFMAGAALHTGMDYSNTLGVKALWPFIGSRLQAGWVFFIDAFVLFVALTALGLTIFHAVTDSFIPAWIAGVTFMLLAGYWILKAWLHQRAKRMAGPRAVSLIPSALWPWRFLVCDEREGFAAVRSLNVRTGATVLLSSHAILDSELMGVLQGIPEWHLMRELSPAYHAIESRTSEGETVIHCRDLRTRNFGSRFGDLEIHLAPSGTLTSTRFYV